MVSIHTRRQKTSRSKQDLFSGFQLPSPPKSLLSGCDYPAPNSLSPRSLTHHCSWLQISMGISPTGPYICPMPQGKQGRTGVTQFQLVQEANITMQMEEIHWLRKPSAACANTRSILHRISFHLSSTLVECLPQNIITAFITSTPSYGP